MNEQEMQFADPDWKPTGQTSVQDETVVTSAGAPRHVNNKFNVNSYDTSQSASISSYKQGYRSQPRQEHGPYILPVTQQVSQSPVGAAHRHSRWWIWLIVIFVFVSLISGMSGGYRPSYNGPFSGRSGGMPIPRQMPQQAYKYVPLPDLSQIQINDAFGSVNVSVGDPGSKEIVVSTYDQDNNGVGFVEKNGVLTVTLNSPSDGNGDLTVTLPPSQAALNLTTTSTNDIEINNYSGQVTAKTDGGAITLSNDTLTGHSSISTNSGNIDLELGSVVGPATITSNTGTIWLQNQGSLSGQVTVSTGGNGDITFNGSLDQNGNYQFSTDSGNIDLTLPGNTSMNIQNSVGAGGSYQSDFPPTNGLSPQASVGVKTNSGTIAIHSQG
jgi:hypothetical protein